MKEHFVFDLDGTLVDSMPRFERAMLSILDEAGVAYDDQLIDIITPLGYTRTAEYYIEHFSLTERVDSLVSRLTEKLVHEYANNIPLKPGVRAYLQKLRAQGAGLYVLTASPHIVTDVCLRRNGVFDCFDAVWSVEDFGLTKTQPQLFETVAQTIGCAMSDVRFFDDNLLAVKTAVAAGWFTYGVYDRQNEIETARLKAAASAFVPSFTALV